MTYPYKFLLETSLMVKDLDEAVELYGMNFGIWPRSDLPIWDISESGAKAAFCAVADPSLAPTLFTLIQPIDDAHWIGKKMKEQAPAPNPYHCFCMVAEDLNDLVRHFDRLGISYNVATERLNTQEARNITGRRIFIGRPKEDILKYDPSFDMNAMIEILSLEETPIWTLPSSQPQPIERLQPGAFVRMESWSLLVNDINQAVRQLAKNFYLWPAPGSIAHDLSEEGIKTILVQIGMPQGTKLELISPYDFNKPIGKWFKKFGMRFYHIRFLVKDLDARLRDLEKKHIAFDLRQAGEMLTYRRAWIDPAHTLGANLEFVDYSDYIRRWGGN